MKKINKKGFTLIELLAVIVVLAIILVITIPTVLGAINDADKKVFDASANSAAKWFESQYNLCKVEGSGAVNEYYKIEINPDCTIGHGVLGIFPPLLEATGLSDDDYSGEVYFQSNGRACVTLTAKPGGKFESLEDYVAKSSGCD